MLEDSDWNSRKPTLKSRRVKNEGRVWSFSDDGVQTHTSLKLQITVAPQQPSNVWQMSAWPWGWKYVYLHQIICNSVFQWEIRKMIMSSTLEKIKGLYRKEKKTWRQDLNHQPSNWEAKAAPVSPARPGAPSPGEAQNWFMLFLVLDSFKSHYHESWGRPAASPRPHVRHVPADRNTNTSDLSRRLSASKQTGY